jgi:hypothetical protein
LESILTYALIVNSTLTAIQRIQGDVLTKSKDSIDADIVALENFIQAILFYDEIVAIDDYIPEHRDERIASFPNVRFLNKEKLGLQPIEQKSQEQASELKPEIRGGEFVNDDFKILFNMLQAHIVCTWDINSSVYHLTLKNLSDNPDEFAKYGNIAAAIFSELSDASDIGGRANSEVLLVDRFGKRIREGYKVPGAKWGDGASTGEASGAIKAFVASLVWLANRSIFYTLTAKYLQADTFLYPIRQVYQQNYISKTCNYGLDYSRNIVDKLASSMSQDLIDVHSGGLSAATATALPVVSAWLARETGDPSRIIKSAYEIREEREFVEARERLREVRRLFDEEDIASANKSVVKIVEEIQKASNDIRIKYGIQTRQGMPTTKMVQVYNTYAAVNQLPQVPDIGVKIKLPEFIYNLKEPRGFRAVYRNLSEDLSTVWALGEARDILGSRVIEDNTVASYNPKQEQPKFRRVHSSWKSPM